MISSLCLFRQSFYCSGMEVHLNYAYSSCKEKIGMQYGFQILVLVNGFNLDLSLLKYMVRDVSLKLFKHYYYDYFIIY